MRITTPLTTLVVVLLFVAGNALGGTLDATIAIFGAGPTPAVAFTYNTFSYNFPAVMLVGTRTDVPNVGGADGLVVSPFEAFCVELGQSLPVGPLVQFDNVLPLGGSTTNPFGGPQSATAFFDATRTLLLGRLWGTWQSSVVDKPTAAAFQLAVWELAFDTDSTLAQGAGLLYGNLLNPTVALAESWLADIRNLNLLRLTQPLLLLTDPNLQDLITPSPDPVYTSPEPSSLVLALLAAFGSMAWIRRRGSTAGEGSIRRHIQLTWMFVP